MTPDQIRGLRIAVLYAYTASHADPIDTPGQVRAAIGAQLRSVGRTTSVSTIAYEAGRWPDTAGDRLAMCATAVDATYGGAR